MQKNERGRFYTDRVDELSVSFDFTLVSEALSPSALISMGFEVAAAVSTGFFGFLEASFSAIWVYSSLYMLKTLVGGFSVLCLLRNEHVYIRNLHQQPDVDVAWCATWRNLGLGSRIDGTDGKVVAHHSILVRPAEFFSASQF